MAAGLALALSGACGGHGPARREPDAAAVAAPTTVRLIEQARGEERARRYDRARALYQQAADTAPDRASAAHAWLQLASALLFWGELADGVRALERVLALDPGSVRAWHDLGVVRATLGDAAGAERALRRATALAPREPRPHVALAALLVKQRRFGEALAEYQALEGLDLPDATRRAIARAIEICRAERARQGEPR
jgi:tetratricopeptide (TPR) repeat protein